MDNIGSGDVKSHLQTLDPSVSRQVADAMRDAFVHSLTFAQAQASADR